MTKQIDEVWTEIIATKEWFAKLVTSEANTLINDSANNPTHQIGTQSYTGDIRDKQTELTNKNALRKGPCCFSDLESLPSLTEHVVEECSAFLF